MLKFLQLIATAVLLCVASIAQAISVTATADKTTVGMGEEIVLTVTVSGTANVAPKFPDMSKFDVRNGGQSSQFSMVNGSTTSEKAFTFFLRPRRVGVALVGAFTIEIDGNRYASEPFEVRVT